MEQHDKEHIGDGKNPQWLGGGNLQGLFINSLAGQYLQFTADAAFRAKINQNQPLTYEVTAKGTFWLTNRLSIMSIIYFFLEANDLYFSYTGFIFSTLRITSSFLNTTARVKLSHTSISYDGLRDSDTSYRHSTNGVLLPPLAGNSVLPDLLNTDNIYTDSSTIRIGINAFSLANKSCVVRDFRIYDYTIAIDKFREKYHEMPLNDIPAFCEWKMSQASDFYTFGGNLYARNTGSSGNGLDNGTGYDMQMFGYIGNIPIFNTIY